MVVGLLVPMHFRSKQQKSSRTFAPWAITSSELSPPC